jgi:D-alanine transaminase
MSRVAYVNGAYVPLTAARVSIMDRGFQLADSIYEVWAVRNGQMFDAIEHLARLKRSLEELRIAPPMSETALVLVIHEVMRRNRVRDGIVYLQISRGVATRDHWFPTPAVKPTIVITAKNLDQRGIAKRAETGVKVISVPETRWARRDIKSVNLLPNVLARQAAKEAGAFEAWFVDEDELVTEGTAATAFIVDAKGRILTRPLSHDLLHGVTRAVLLRVARERQMPLLEQAFSIEDAKAAREAFISSASNPAVAVVAIDDVVIGDGRPGPVATALRAAYLGA